jgi:hypothetical protein
MHEEPMIATDTAEIVARGRASTAWPDPPHPLTL